MKNIHLLPTDKPSRLVKLKLFGKDRYNFSKEVLPIQDEEQYQNIYITSDGEIKKGDWFYDSDGELCEYTSDYTVDPNTWEDNKKIILTTDQNLINDGVQAIDDTFLEWFVKNPSCEEIRVLNKVDFFSKVNDKLIYKIIIPQEELKQETLTYTEAAKKEERIFNSTMMSKQETLEEFINSQPYYGTCTIEYKEGIEVGAKWQAKRMYSEEEVRELFKQYKEEFSIYRNLQILNAQFEEWFEQFKKK